MSKGSTRRPAQVAPDEWARRWGETFPERRSGHDRRADEPRRAKHRTGSGRRTGRPDRRQEGLT
jgi:hypothetical protein